MASPVSPVMSLIDVLNLQIHVGHGFLHVAPVIWDQALAHGPVKKRVVGSSDPTTKKRSLAVAVL